MKNSSDDMAYNVCFILLLLRLYDIKLWAIETLFDQVITLVDIVGVARDLGVFRRQEVGTTIFYGFTMTTCLEVLGSFVIKLIMMCSHFQMGISRDCNFPCYISWISNKLNTYLHIWQHPSSSLTTNNPLSSPCISYLGGTRLYRKFRLMRFIHKYSPCVCWIRCLSQLLN